MTDPGKKILVYHHRFPEFVKDEGVPVEGLDKDASGLGVTTEGSLDNWLHDHPEYQSTVKRLQHRASNIYQVDLLTSDQVKDAQSQVNHEQNVGSIKVPLLQWHLNRYRELHIISHSSFKPTDVEVEVKAEEPKDEGAER